MSNKYDKEFKIKVKDVYASLRNGRVYSEAMWAVSYITILVLVVPTTIGSIIAGVLDNNLLYAIGIPSFGVVLIITGLILLITTKSSKKRASKCLEDSVILEANCTSLGSVPVVRFPAFFSKAMAIEVAFQYNGDLYIRQSERKGKPLYLIIYNKYANRKIMTAYSPKYDEVMLLKD